MVEIDLEKKESRSDRPTLPVAPQTVTVFKDISRDTPLEELRNNVEECIKLAGLPIEDVVKSWDEIDLIDEQFMQDGKLHSFRDKVMKVHRKVQRSLGEAKGYKAALAQAVIAQIQQELREKKYE